MADTRLPASGAIRLRWHASNAFANFRYPTVTELNAGLDIADSTSWNDYSFGTQSSTTTSDPALTAKSNVTDRGTTQYGGSISLYHPRVRGDITNAHSNVEAALSVPRTVGYISMSIDGDLSETTTPLYTGGATRNYVSGDYVHIFRVMTASYTDAVTGEEAFRYTINMVPQGEAAVYTVAGSGAATVVVSTGSSGAVGTKLALTATVNGRPFTRGLRWTSSDPTKATVSQNGVVTRVAVGTATITATFTASGASATATVTVA